MTYTIERLKEQWTSTSDPAGIFDYYRIIPELIAEVESLTRQLRAEEITGLNMRLRTARECAQISDEYGNFSDIGGAVVGNAIRKKFEVPA